MSNFLDKVKVNTALTKTTKLDLGCDHISTANFMQYNVAYAKEMVPQEKISINMETFTRLNPMPVPTFGRARINNRAFFVPFRTIFPGWNDFITDSNHVFANGVTGRFNSVPTISNSTFVQLFTDATAGFATGVPTDEADFTAQVGSNSGAYKFTYKGRQAMKMIESLGYKIIWSEAQTAVVSALPIMAAAKIYADWYYPSAYSQNDTISTIEQLFKQDISNTYALTKTQLQACLEVMYWVNYDSDYFVSAWDNPVNPNDGSFSAVSFTDPTAESTSAALTISNAENGNAPSTAMSGGKTLTTWAIDALKSLTDYMKRHQLAGARALDRYLARFGVKLASEKLGRCYYIGSNTHDIQFGDIMSTADTEGSQLGNYAGKGIGYGNSSFDFKTDEYGIIMIISTIQPKAGYYQGMNRNVMHTSRFDFYTPEFDNLGTQAISKAEVYVPTIGTTNFQNLGSLRNGVFGWTPRYAEYKVGRDMITGDFRYDSINVGQEAWHTMRELTYTDANDMVHNVDFVLGKDADQYSRIFYNTDADAADKFNVIYHFEIASYSPMKALFDTYEFEEKGDKVVMDANGVKMN